MQIGISDAHRQELANLLNALLADEFVLYVKTRNAHWNVTGPSFLELHKFFESQYHDLEETIDEVAERVRAIGHFAAGSLKDFSKLARLTEDKLDFGKQENILRTLLDDHESLIRILRKDAERADELKDIGTTDFMTGLLEQHEKMAWMLRAYLGK